ncbi:MAG: galactose-1-phosphate uridylyltransferase [Deltaproteobacteria bacterium]|nr:galactose-1-phosphate uridylyltransferase [Deltaproteobacteria bacterium]
MAEMRLDPTTMSWVITGKEVMGKTDLEDVCPFCPGNEDRTPSSIHEIGENGNWKVRVFPDINPVFRIEYSEDREAELIYSRMKNRGAHEIIVEHPSHNISLSDMELKDIICVFDAYANRIEDLKNDKRMKQILLFKNRGEFTGTRIKHIHSHLMATPMIPKRIEQELRFAQYHYKSKERCLFCDIIHQEIKYRKRIIFENDGFIAICPYASRFPYEVWIFPKKHSYTFEKAMKYGDYREMLAESVKFILSRIESVTPHYYMVLHNSPNENSSFVNGEGKTLRDDFHWHFEILPLLKEMKRFKWEEEFYVNPVTPEDAARVLRMGD